MKRISTDAEYLANGKLVIDADGIPMTISGKADQSLVDGALLGIDNPTQSANDLRDPTKTYYWSSDTNAAGKNLPVDRSGVLTNHRANFNDSFTVQTYLPFRDPNLYIRYFYQNTPYTDYSTDADGWVRFPSSTVVESLLSEKADKLLVDNELIGKADKLLVDNALLGISNPTQSANDLRETAKTYYWSSDANATGKNLPVNRSGVLTNRRFSFSDSSSVQTYLPFRNPNLYVRYFYQNAPYTDYSTDADGWVRYPSSWAVESMISDAITDAIADLNSGDDEDAIPARSSLTSITCFGDSLTDGYSNNVRWGEEESYPAALGRELGAGVTVTKRGMSGATSATINLRAGATPVTFRVPAGTIPGARWSVIPLETNQEHNEWASGAVTRYGYIGGGYGTLKLAEGAWTFTRGENVDDVTSDFATFFGEYKDAASDTIIYGAGRNDITKNLRNIYSSPVESVKASVIGMLDFSNAQTKQVAFLGTITRTDETPESEGYKQVYEVNNWIRDRYPDRHIDLQGYLTGSQVWTDTGITPTQTDLDAQEQGMSPPSLFDDVTHYSKATAEAIGSKLVAGWLRARGWVV